MVKGDTLNELDETFTLSLSNPINLSLNNTPVKATIVMDDFAKMLNDTGVQACADSANNQLIAQ